MHPVIVRRLFLSSPSTSSALNADIRELYIDHHAWLLGWLRKRLRHGDSAADVAQDTFMHILGKPERLQELRQPRAWLSTVAHGLLVDRVRRQRVERAFLEAIAHLPQASVPSPESQMILLETLARVDALLDGLRPKVRMAFLMSRLEGLGYKDISERLGVSLGSVEKYMACAIRHCYLAQR
jgi:RNA polymerase sigma-70 factor (ECF subfamily)